MEITWLVFFTSVFKNLNLFYLSKSLCKQVSEIKQYTIVKKLCDYLSSFCHLRRKTKEEKQQGNPLHLFPLCEHYQVSNIQVRPNKASFCACIKCVLIFRDNVMHALRDYITILMTSLLFIYSNSLEADFIQSFHFLKNGKTSKEGKRESHQKDG